MDEHAKQRIKELRAAIRDLRNHSQLSIKELETEVRKANPLWPGKLSPYLDENRPLPKALAQALDTVFTTKFADLGYPQHAIADARATGSTTALTTFLNHIAAPDPPGTGEQSPSPTTEAAGPDSISTQPSTPGSVARVETAVLVIRRRLPMILAVCLAVAVTAALGFWLWVKQPTRVVSGTIHCESGQPVTGVFVAIGWMPDGTWARTRPDTQDPAGMIYNADVPAELPYALHIGCGGTPALWAVETRTPKTTATVANYLCDDQPNHVTTPPFIGTCTQT